MYGKSFLRWWRFRQAYSSGAIDFYMKVVIFIGTLVALRGAYKGYKNRGNFTYYDHMNMLKMEEVHIEMEMVKVLMEMEKIHMEDEEMQ